MVLPGLQVWRWILFACIHWLCVCQETPRPVYMVAVPAVIQAGSEAKLCASLLQPNETLVMTVSLMADGQNKRLLHQSSDQEFHRCVQFQAPRVNSDKVQNFKVEVRGETFLSTEERRVMIKPYSPMTFIQTDKPIYKPGQTVLFRVVTLDTHFSPVNQLYNIVELEDVNHNRIGQWVNTTSSGNILQLSHPLNSEAPVGSYTIVVWIGGEKIYHNFKVEQYVLPKFEINMNLTDKISVVQEEYEVKVCAEYTYGQPVPGKAGVKLCRPLVDNAVIPITVDERNPQGVPDYTPPCHKESIEMDHTGCASYVFNMALFTKNAGEKLLGDVFSFHAEVQEEGTGITLSEERNVELSYVIGEFTFVDTPQIYEHGSIIEGKINAVRFNNTPISDMLVYLFEEKGWSSYLRLQNLTTDSRGIARFSVNTTSLPKENINLVVSDTPQVEYPGYRVPYFNRGQHLLSLIQPAAPDIKPSSSLAIQKVETPLACGQAVSITIRYAIVGETVPKGSVAVLYLALSRGVIVQHGHINVTVQQDSPVAEGDVTLTLAVVPEMAPVVQLLVYSMLPSETVIAHSMNFPTEKCFRNKVLVEFSPSNAVPGEENTLHLSARPGSLCGLGAVDQSVGIMEPGKRLDADKIFNLLPVKETTYVPYELEDPVACLRVRPRRSIIPHPYGPSEQTNDPYAVFQTLGLKLATNLDIRVRSCLSYQGNQYYRSYVAYSLMARPGSAGPRLEMAVAGGLAAPPPPPIQTVRTFFPETWIWDLVEVGESGSLDVPLTVPDTITTWETEVFCLAPSGFGLAPLVELTVFQPFFLELTLPYSVIRGEHFELKATVFNYLSKCIMVSVTPALSSDYTLTPLRDVQDSSCLCANGRKTFSWTLAPSVLGVLNVSVSAAAVRSQTACDNGVVNVPERGRVDTVTRSLLVKAEGTEKSHTYNWLLCPTGEALTEEVELQLPQNVVDGSARISLSVLGDILGRALNNLDGLLQMPYGCGEQNMALLSPNIYILEYLRNTEQLTPAILEKATKFLTSGYQRQLNYKNADGAYSTFGQGLGNTWLTAFVLRSFGKAQSFIYVDPATMEQSKTWLERQQGQRGCFRTLGKLLNNRIKGGVTDEVTLTAYITASMLELNMSVTDHVVDHSLSCLKNSTSDLSNTYATALLAYTFTLAGDMETRARLLQHLDTISFQEGGLLHWSQSSSETSPSLEVEISSYVLLASLSASSRSTSDLGYASRIVRWLVRQQNAYGGFSSTQDTVVALQALALYSTRVFSRGGASTVTVRSPSGDRCLFHVNQNNKLLYQERALQDTEGKYSVEVQGSACASVQVVLRYNVPSPTRRTTLSIQVTPEVDCNRKSLRPRVTLKLQSRYHGKELTTNMIIVDLKMLSGFSPDPDSLGRLRGSSQVDRVDIKDDHVLMYLTELTSLLPFHITLDIIQEFPVQNLKPAVVKIYDYYQPSDKAETEYVFPCN
ncbi:alpha-2-macroglobulin-like isoform X1 [Oncorhynchus mykiss]|uniref:alpha-2-macroglobulin-like isoform X1 n=2 Tax=Oncorhynchus mykiss TaxID=8022 RepID=UPI00187826F2|nr:alpha-2-macroglobulin-like isoform X1 [Oncorhynchus mykiss]XP_036829760.1 alpha-2-macroglobulin-like isoform X1 [Oncorhynchus mykiss]